MTPTASPNESLLLRAALTALLLTGTWAFPTVAGAWPIDGYEDTGIRRLEEYRLTVEGQLDGTPLPRGARLPTEAIDIRLTQHRELDLPEPDPELGNTLRELLGEHADAYGIAMLDMTNPGAPIYAEWRGDYRQNVGSVGKILGALGLFQALADTYPEDNEARRRILHDTVLTADAFSQHDHHTVHMFDVDTRELVRRSIEIGDQATLWEYLDWMLSVSSNSAAAMVMRDAMILRAEGKDYPIPDEQIPGFFENLGSSGRTQLFQQTFWEPVTRNGLDLDRIRQGSFFTQGGKKRVNGGGNSYATARSLVELTLRMEQGRLVDEWSSRMFKRLLYLTERRIRYASSPKLNDAAVYFKSGSLYSCKEEAGFKCGKYRGNVRNYMNSLAIVEQEVDGVRLHYVVALISNVLKENSAVAHQTLGGQIHELMKERHRPATSAAP